MIDSLNFIAVVIPNLVYAMPWGECEYIGASFGGSRSSSLEKRTRGSVLVDARSLQRSVISRFGASHPLLIFPPQNYTAAACRHTERASLFVTHVLHLRVLRSTVHFRRSSQPEGEHLAIHSFLLLLFSPSEEILFHRLRRSRQQKKRNQIVRIQYFRSLTYAMENCLTNENKFRWKKINLM